MSRYVLILDSPIPHNSIQMYETILYEKSGAVLTITLNRPDRYNAFNAQLHTDLAAAMKEAARDNDVRAVIITGAGKAFCSGQDLKEVKDRTDIKLSHYLRTYYNPNIFRIRSLEKPVICALNGVAAGAGMSVALACDVIIAATSASLIQSFVNVGLVPDCGSTWFLTRLVGYHAAFDICATGRKIEMAEAKSLGLVGEVVENEELMNRAGEVAARYAAMPTKAIGLMKRALNKTFVNDLESTLEYEAYMQEIAGESEDYKEGVAAFNEKRKPVFKGK